MYPPTRKYISVVGTCFASIPAWSPKYRYTKSISISPFSQSSVWCRQIDMPLAMTRFSNRVAGSKPVSRRCMIQNTRPDELATTPAASEANCLSLRSCSRLGTRTEPPARSGGPFTKRTGRRNACGFSSRVANSLLIHRMRRISLYISHQHGRPMLRRHFCHS